jgi:SH3-like domain-containing protein
MCGAGDERCAAAVHVAGRVGNRRSLGRSAAVILYDAPSLNARRLFILNQGYPVEIIVSLEGWYKVRDATGASHGSRRRICLHARW